MSVPDLLISGTRISLRPLLESDLDFVCQLDSDPRVTEHLPGAGDATREQRLEWLRSFHVPTQAEPWGFFALLIASQTEPIGWLHLRPERDAPEYWELGWRLKAEFWGHGYATEAARLLMDHSRRQLDSTKFSAHALTANKASIRIMRKLGLSRQKPYLWRDEIPAERWTLESK